MESEPITLFIVQIAHCDANGEEARNFRLTTALLRVAMTSGVNKGFRVLLLGAYVPVALAIGLMHSDDLPYLGDGHHSLSRCHAQSTEHIPAHGFCLACQFTAGHVVEADDPMPALAVETSLSVAQTSHSVASPLPIESVRAPPSILPI